MSVSKPFFFIRDKLLPVRASVMGWGFVSKEVWQMKHISYFRITFLDL